MSLRDAEFADQYNSYLTTTNALIDDHKLPHKNVSAKCQDHDSSMRYLTRPFAAHEDWFHQCWCPSRWYERGDASRCCLLP
jgi:hypothetical protein